MSHLIGLDLGTTTVVGVLFDAARGRVLRVARRRNDAAQARSALPTRAEQDPARLRTLALQVLAALGEEGAAVDGIWLTGQKHGLLCVDATNRPLTLLISWQDRRTAEHLPGTDLTTLDQLHARLDDLDWRDNGCRIAHGYGAATLFWLVQRGELPTLTRRVCTIAGWLCAQLAGQPPVTDPTFAASWGIYSLAEAAWNASYLERLGIDAQLLPPVLPSGKALGGLQSEIARQVGLAAGTPVHSAIGDTQASFLGACLPPGILPRVNSGFSGGTVEGLAQVVFLNIGTGGQICWAVPRFQPPTEAVETRPLLPGCYLRVGASLCGGAAYAWLNRTVRGWLSKFGLDLGEDAVYERLNTLAAEGTSRHGLRVRPTFLGVRGDPTIEAGAIEGITLDNMQLGALARATLAGMVDELGSLYDAHAGPPARYREVIAAGGAVQRNPLLPGLIEERFGLPVRMPEFQETAAVGAVVAR
jgi:sugar (pentulose or hexulose) kinase